MINLKQNRYSLELAYNLKPSISNEFKYNFSTIFCQILDLSKNAPIFLIKDSKEIKNLAIAIKEHAALLSNELSALIKYQDTSEKNTTKKFQCTRPDCLTITNTANSISENTYVVHISQVASGQINKSNPVSKSACPFHAGTYRFFIKKGKRKEDFSLKIENATSNQDIFYKMKEHIDKSQLGVSCNISEENKNIVFSIQSDTNQQNGTAEFQIEDANFNFIHFYNLNTIYQKPYPSEFYINGNQSVSYNTSFFIDELFELTLLKKCDDDILIQSAPDNNYIFSSFNKILESLNFLLNLSQNITIHKLEQELLRIIENNKDDLINAGIELDDSFLLFMNELSENSNLAKLYSSENSFVYLLLDSVEKVIIDPINYIPKKVVSYPDFSKPHFLNSYITSVYSGFIYSAYC